MSIQVRAKASGFYGGVLRNPGAEFPINSEKDLGKWMVKLTDEEKVNPPKKSKKTAAAEGEDASDDVADDVVAKEALKAAQQKLQEAIKGGNKEAIEAAQAELDALEPPLA